jgi:hypothetical protein
MHTDVTLTILDGETTSIGSQLRRFQSETCSAYQGRELTREARARARRDCKKGSSAAHAQERRPKTLNLQTYKVHSIGDYVETIKQYGTTDSYSTQIVSFLSFLLYDSLHERRAN